MKRKCSICRKGQVPLTVCLPKELYTFYKALPKELRAEFHRKVRQMLAELKARYEVTYVMSCKSIEE